MSSQAIRDAARALVTGPGWVPPIPPYVETVNETPDVETLPDEWSTLGFVLTGDEATSLGRDANRREIGLVRVAIFTEAKRGEAPAPALAELVKGLVFDHSWGVGVFLDDVAGPVIDDEGGDGRWLRSDVEIRYRRDYPTPTSS